MLESEIVGREEKNIWDYDYVLVDSSVMNPLGFCPKNCSSDEIKMGSYQDQLTFLDFIINEGTDYFYLSKLIFDELNDSFRFPFSYKKRIKRSPSNVNSKLLRLIRTTIKKERKMIDFYVDNGKILSFSEEDKKAYMGLSKKYNSLKERNSLSEADFDFLISGLVLSQKGESSALLSNDFGIVKSWKFILYHRNIFPEKFGFFLRHYFPNFEKLSLP